VKNIVEPDRPQMTVWHLHIAWWIPKATNSHSEYVVFIAFSLQQWLHEHVSVRCMYIACLVNFFNSCSIVTCCGCTQKVIWT